MQQRTDDADFRLRQLDPRLRLTTARHRVETLQTAMVDRLHLGIVHARGRLDSLASQLAQLSPLGILERGYAIVQNEEGGIVKDAGAAAAESLLDIRLARGRLQARVLRGAPLLLLGMFGSVLR